MGHYFINDTNLKSNKKNINYTFLGENISFATDNGVFSKERIDFGTNLLLNSIEDLTQYKTLLDVGCGIGVIGIAIAKKYPLINVQMIDVNQRAISLAKENIKNNRINNCICYESNVYENVNDFFDVIVSNPPIRAGKEIVHKIASEAKNHLNKNGVFYAVVQKKQGANSFEKKLEEVFENVDIVNKDCGYVIFKSIKK